MSHGLLSNGIFNLLKASVLLLQKLAKWFCKVNLLISFSKMTRLASIRSLVFLNKYCRMWKATLQGSNNIDYWTLLDEVLVNKVLVKLSGLYFLHENLSSIGLCQLR